MISGREDDAVYIYDNTGPDGVGVFTGAWKSLPENAYHSNLKDIDFNDKISALWIHPRISARMAADSDFRGTTTVATGSGNIRANDLKTTGLFDGISSISVSSKMPLAEWKLKCCRNEVTPYTDANKCGKYWSQDPSFCGNMDCAEKLTSDSVCQTWCRNNPSRCDTLKTEFCRNHPESPYCGCILDTPAAAAQRSQYPSITAPRQCWSESDCQKTDLVNTFITADLKRENCPDVVSQIQNIINSNITGSNISMRNEKNEYNSEPPPPPPTDYTLIYIFIFIIIIITVSVSAYLIFGGDIDSEFHI